MTFADIDSDIVTFFGNDMGLNSTNLNNINLDDNNFGDCHPETITIIVSSVWLGITDLNNVKYVKKK